MTRTWTIAALAALATLAFMQGQGQDVEEDGEGIGPAEATADTTVQPIAFPHDIHAGQYGIDCQFCHYSAERSVAAGMPPMSTCLGCHQVIPGSRNPGEIVAVRSYAENGEAIPWVRIYKVADHVHFPHMRHVTAGVECQTCHGEVEEMGVVEEVNQSLSMGWCVSCHREQGADYDCTSCHY